MSCNQISTRLEPIMLKNLPISYSFPNFPKFLPIILFLFPWHHQLFLSQCRSDQIYIVTDCINRMFDCSIRVFRSFCKLGGRAQQAFGRSWALLGMPLAMPVFETNVSCISQCFSQLSFQLFLFYACAQPILLELFSPKL